VAQALYWYYLVYFNMANQVCSNCNYSHYFPYPQNKIQCQCGNTVSLGFQLSTIEQNEIDTNANVQDSTSQSASIKNNNTKELSGIGGWLLIPAIGLIFAPIKSVASFYLGINMIKNFSPELLDDPRFWLIGLIDIVNIVAGIIIAVFFFKKLILAKKAIIGLMLAVMFFTICQTLLNISIFGEGDFEFFKPVLHAIVFGSIWIPYFLKSKRVKNTFVN
jgi:hypothetical protein